MRLDLFLKVCRMMPGRTRAKQVCDSGGATVNGRPAKASLEVKPGDEIRLAYAGRVVVFRAEAVPGGKNVSREQARSLITPISDERQDLFS